MRLELWVLLEAAGAVAGEFIAVGLDAHAFHLRLKAQPAGDAVVQQRDVLVLKLNDAITIEADEVIVLGLVEEIGVVVCLIATELHDAQEIAFLKEAEGAVNGGAGDGAVNFPDHVQQFICIEVAIRGKGCLDDNIPLSGVSQALGGKVLAESFIDSCVHYRGQISQQVRE